MSIFKRGAIAIIATGAFSIVPLAAANADTATSAAPTQITAVNPVAAPIAAFNPDAGVRLRNIFQVPDTTIHPGRVRPNCWVYI